MKRFVLGEKVTAAEKFCGYLLGPAAVGVLTAVAGSYLNVYYTDVLGLGSLWNGAFISLFPLVVKALSCLVFLWMGSAMDRTAAPSGKARPWLRLSIPLLAASMAVLFCVPRQEKLLWLIGSYLLFYAVTVPIYNSSHTLLLPLATKDPAERSSLSLWSSVSLMAYGTLVSVLFPSLVLPALGIDPSRWSSFMISLAVIALPFMLLEYFFTKERVQPQKKQEVLSQPKQFAFCKKSKGWLFFMLFTLLWQFANQLGNAGTFYYCNWVLGSYNDGITQLLFYAIGNAPLGIGVVLCNPLCKKFGRKNTLTGGMLLAAAGVLLCVLFPHSLPLVLLGQTVKAFGIIPITVLGAALLGDALDLTERQSGLRCDGFTSSVYNCILTLCSGLAFCFLNFGIGRLGYLVPTEGMIPLQPEAVQQFFIFCAMGCQLLLYPVCGWLLHRFGKELEKTS